MILEGLREIREDRHSGASQLTLKALKVLRLAAENVEADSLEDFLLRLKVIGVKIREARPSMAPLAHMAGKFLWNVRKALENQECSLEGARLVAANLAEKLAREYVEALRLAALNAAQLLVGGCLVATCSYSSQVAEAIGLAKARGNPLKVLVATSKHRGISHGLTLASKLRRKGVKVEVFADERLDAMASQASIILLGADALLPEGSIINGWPSLKLAEAAAKRGRPVYVVCDSSKISPYNLKPEEGFDLVPARLIRGIAMEMGVLRPEELSRLAYRVEGYWRML